MKTLAHINTYNRRFFGKPWAAALSLDDRGRLRYDFDSGKFTGIHKSENNSGDVGILEPIEGMYYAYGQKGKGGAPTAHYFVKFHNGEFEEVTRMDVMRALIETA